MLQCKNCGAELFKSEEHQLCMELLEMHCPECDQTGKLVWEPQPLARGVRKINATFDYYCQIWRSADGAVVQSKRDWDFACPKCTGPAKMISCDCYAEHHECLECNFHFDVK